MVPGGFLDQVTWFVNSTHHDRGFKFVIMITFFLGQLIVSTRLVGRTIGVGQPTYALFKAL